MKIELDRIDYFVIGSLLVHGAIFSIPVHHKPGDRASPASAATFVARLVEAPRVVVPDAAPERIPEKVAPVVRPLPVVTPKTVAVAPRPVPIPVPKPVPVDPVETPAKPQFDMLAMINARRQSRQQYEQALAQREQALTSMQPGAADPTAAINRNLATLNATQDGTGGVFTILSKGTRTGEFAFNGFRPDTQRKWREVIEVDAGLGGDIERAMVRRMIELIRSHYTGDFIWRSHRLGKNVVMSARPEDGPELEDFLMREFFDTPTLAQKAH